MRIALGASRVKVIGMVLGQGLRLALVGLMVGLVGAFAGGGLLRRLLFGVSRTDVATYVAVGLAVLGVALLASYLPAGRATRVEPMQALRSE